MRGVIVSVSRIGYRQFVINGKKMRRVLTELYELGIPISEIKFVFPF